MKNISKIEFLLFSIALFGLAALISCGAAQRGEKTVIEKPAGLIAEAEEDFNPLADPRDRIPVEGETVPEQVQTPASDTDPSWAHIDSFLLAQEEIDTSITVYRIQLFASQYFTEARYEQQIAQEVFDDSIFVKYDLPYYKVLLGNTTSERQGRRLLYTARSLGYYNSWLIESPPDSIYYRMLYIEDSIAAADSLMNLKEQPLAPEPEAEGEDF